MAKLPRITQLDILGRTDTPKEEEGDLRSFICLGHDGPLHFAVVVAPVVKLVTFQRSAAVTSAREEEWSPDFRTVTPVVSLPPGTTGSASFVDRPRRGVGSVTLVESSIRMPCDVVTRRALFESAWKAANSTNVLFGNDAKFAVPANRVPPGIEFQLKRAYGVRFEYRDRPEFPYDPQWRVFFRVGAAKHLMNLPMLSHQQDVPIDSPDRHCLVAVRLTPPYGQHWQCFKVVVGVVPVPDDFEFARRRARTE